MFAVNVRRQLAAFDFSLLAACAFYALIAFAAVLDKHNVLSHIAELASSFISVSSA